MTTKWNANLYDQKHDFVSKFGENLVDLLAPQKHEHILDVGCGTGDLANEIALAGAVVLGIDASNDMINSVLSKNSRRLRLIHRMQRRWTIHISLTQYFQMLHYIG